MRRVAEGKSGPTAASLSELWGRGYAGGAEGVLRKAWSPGDSDQAVHDTAPDEPDVGGPKPDGAAQDEAVSSSDDGARRAGPGGGRDRSGGPTGRARWFEELPMVSKALLGGVAILVALPLLILHKPARPGRGGGAVRGRPDWADRAVGSAWVPQGVGFGHHGLVST